SSCLLSSMTHTDTPIRYSPFLHDALPIYFVFSPESGDKRTRASALAAQVNVGNVRMLRGDWNQTLLNALAVFPMGAHDDLVDAASRAYNDTVTARSAPMIA